MSVTHMNPIRSQDKRNLQNDMIMHKLNAAETAVNNLVHQGYTVVEVQLEQVNPVIWIEYTPLCKKLCGTWLGQTGGPTGRHYIWQKMMSSCRVQWTTREKHN